MAESGKERSQTAREYLTIVSKFRGGAPLETKPALPPMAAARARRIQQLRKVMVPLLAVLLAVLFVALVSSSLRGLFRSGDRGIVRAHVREMLAGREWKELEWEEPPAVTKGYRVIILSFAYREPDGQLVWEKRGFYLHDGQIQKSALIDD